MAKTQPPIDNSEACELVGRYLQTWASMEITLNDCIASALDLDFSQQCIVCSNISLRDKVFIARTALSIAVVLNEDKARFDKTLDKISTLARSGRNLLAHTFFAPSEDGDSVSFFQVRAKGSLEYPSIKWKRTDFYSKLASIESLNKSLMELNGVLKNGSRLKSLATALISSAPNLMFGEPGLHGLLDPHPQDSQHLDTYLPSDGEES
jgi:hypothetical protein